MSEWWTYQASDFLMFSPQIYWRLFASLNQTFWPVQPLLILGAGAWLVWLRRRDTPFAEGSATKSTRSSAAVIALCWFVVAWAFLWQRFAPVNWIAGDFAWAFGAQGLLLLAAACAGVKTGKPATRRRAAGLALAVWALLGHPLLGLTAGRELAQLEIFGLAPDPTSIGTLAWLLLIEPGESRLSPWLLRALWFVPLSWCLASAAMFWAMADWQGWVMLAAASLATAAALVPTSSSLPSRRSATVRSR